MNRVNYTPVKFVSYFMPLKLLALSPKPLALAVAVGIAAAASACDVRIKDGDLSMDIASARATEEWTRQYPLALGGHVEITNINGPVDIAGGAESVEVHAVITAKALTDAAAKELLAGGRIEETITPERVAVRTVGPRRGGHTSYNVRYDVRVPSHAQVVVRNTNGKVTARAVGGGVNAVVTNGNVEVEQMSAPVDASAVNGRVAVKMSKVSGNIRLEVTNGSVSLELPASTSAVLSARTVNGGITVSGLDIPPSEDANPRRQRRLDATLNGGGPAIELRTTNGRITITGKPE